MVSFRRRDSDATRQPERAPVLPTDPLLSVQRPPYLVYVQAKNALTAAGEVVPVCQGDGQVREMLADLPQLRLPGLPAAGAASGHGRALRRRQRADGFPARLRRSEGSARRSVGAVAVHTAPARKWPLASSDR